MSADLTPTERAVEAAADALHQHGDTHSGRQTPDWRDCPRAQVHEGAGRDVAAAVLDAVGYDALKAERDRYRTALESIRRGWVSDGRPSSIARAALDSDPDLAERTRRIRADE